MINIKTTNPTAPKSELRERIILTAMEAFTQNGIKTITMDDIANKLAISKRTLYETFKDKEDLLVECIKYHREEGEQYMLEVLNESENVLEVILKIFKKSLEVYHQTNKRFFEDMHKYPRVEEIAKRKREEDSEYAIAFFKKGIEQGIFRADVNLEIVYMLISQQVNLLRNTDLCETYSFIEVYESILFVFMRGISTERGQQILEDFVKEYRLQK